MPNEDQETSGFYFAHKLVAVIRSLIWRIESIKKGKETAKTVIKIIFSCSMKGVTADPINIPTIFSPAIAYGRFTHVYRSNVQPIICKNIRVKTVTTTQPGQAGTNKDYENHATMGATFL